MADITRRTWIITLDNASQSQCIVQADTATDAEEMLERAHSIAGVQPPAIRSVELLNPHVITWVRRGVR